MRPGEIRTQPAWVRKDRPKPRWLVRGPLDTRASRISHKYWTKIWNATPLWATREPVAALYRQAAYRRAQGEAVEVDHIVPLTSNLVCGLHWHGNLRIISKGENASKSNNYWPNMPNEQVCLAFYSKK